MADTKKIKKPVRRVSREKKETKREKVRTIKPKAASEKVDALPIEIAAVADAKQKSEYLFGVGRRKTSIAQVKIYKKGEGKLKINGKDIKEYFPVLELQERIFSPFRIVGQMEKLDLTAKVRGGGICSQADAVRHGASRALLQLNPNFRKPLKKAGFLTRDPRKKERKKPGLKRARKAPQWAKR